MRPEILLLSTLLALGLAGCGKPDASITPATPAAATDHDAAAGGDHDDEENGRQVHLSPEQLRNSDIGLAEVQAAGIREVLPLYGVIAPNAERVRTVSARFPGVVRSVNVKVGDSVRQGAPLAVVESNESLRDYTVSSPLAGIVTARNANPGEQSESNALFTVADLSTVWAEISVFPKDLPKIRVGQRVRVRSADGGLGGEGTLVHVAAIGNSQSQTLSARALLDNRDGRWAPGLYVTVEVVLSEAQVPAAIDSQAVQSVEGQSVVFVLNAEGFAVQPVRLGRNDGERTEVLEGLSPGDRYASRNSFVLKSELGKGEAGHDH